MNGKRLDIRAERTDWGRYINILLSLDDGTGDAAQVAQPMVFVDAPDFGCHAEPSLKLTPHDAQQLMDELWRCGLRPTE